jgi:O-antigen ligase
MVVFNEPKFPVGNIFCLWILLFFFGPFIFFSRVLYNTSLEIERVAVLLCLFFFMVLRSAPLVISKRFIVLGTIYFLSLIMSIDFGNAFRYFLVIPLVYFVAENLVRSITDRIGFSKTLLVVCLVVLLSQSVVLVRFAFIDRINVLNFYASESLEEFGIKSNYVGWSCAVIVPILLLLMQYYRSFVSRIGLSFLVILCFALILGSGSRSAALSALLSMSCFFLLNFRKFAWLVILCACSAIYGYTLIIKNDSLQQVSFVERQERLAKGIANDEYRLSIYEIALMDIVQADDSRILFGYGANNFNEYLNIKSPALARYRLSSHSMYIEIFVSFGILGFLVIFFLFVLKPLVIATKMRLLYLLIPVGVISIFENNLGPGQFLFGTFIVYSILFYPNERSSCSRTSLS